ncbi:MAG: tryptophan 7-halogenase [Asticcacaulis sp.]|nr:tryptophan 7-halogenase [Asticcacaulis sp.]
MSAQTIKTVTIVGGGTAGWMTAAALVKALSTETRITLIESEEIGTIGVGEATVPSINLFNTLLGIDVPEFMRACEATFKLGIEFADWGGVGEQYMHPFTNFGPDVANPNFPRVWMHHARERQAELHLDDYNLGCLAARQGRFVLPQKGQAPRIGPLAMPSISMPPCTRVTCVPMRKRAASRVSRARWSRPRRTARRAISGL